MFNKYILINCIFVVCLLAGCGEVSVYDVDTKYSHSVMVPPVTAAEKSVFIRVKDSSGYASEVAFAVEQELKKSGYKIHTDPGLARFKLMVNVIKFGSGTDEDYIMYLQAIDPKRAADLLLQKNTHKTVRKNTNIYNRDTSSFLKPKKNDAYIDHVQEERVQFSRHADRVALADIEIIGTKGESLRTRVMTGVDFRGGFFVAPTQEVSQYGWTRLINRMAIAISSLF